MPRIGITAYDLLISCPEDVLDYLDVVKDSVENFNRVFGVINNIEVVIKHWSTDSYPQSGDKPQEILNKQFVRDCDAAIAIFWTKFGTPTDKYDSGTEEEIEEMLSVGKQVFMYFLDAPIKASIVDMNQYQKVLDFREKYKDRGVYAVIKDKQELQRQFTNHLTLYFLPLISGEKVVTNEKLKPILLVRDKDASSEKCFSIYKNNLCESRFMNTKKEAIFKEIQVLKNTVLPSRLVVDSKEPKDRLKESPSFLNNNDIQKLMGNINLGSGTMKDADIGDIWKRTIKDFAEKNEIYLDDDFWNVGNLKEQIFQFKHPFNNGPSFEGTEKEKERYKLLVNLYWNVETYNEYIEHFIYIDEISIAKLVISNVGNSYDEDIDVKLKIPKGHILNHSDLPYPGINIIEKLLEMRFTDFIFSIQESDTVEKYGYYPIQPPSYNKDLKVINPFSQITASEEYENNKKDYQNSLESLFLYRVFENEDNDILIFHIEYLKHNTSMAFPSVLMFH